MTNKYESVLSEQDIKQIGRGLPSSVETEIALWFARMIEQSTLAKLQPMLEAIGAGGVSGRAPEGYKLVPVDTLTTILESIQSVLYEAYNNAHQECCGKGYGECCGNSITVWDDADNKIMDVLSPSQRLLSDILATAQEPEK